MKTEVELNFCDLDLDFARTGWDSAEMALALVNEVLKDRGIDIVFEINVHEEQDYPEEFWNEDSPNYNRSGVVIKEINE